MAEAISAFWSQYGDLLLVGTRDTLVMTLVSTLFAYVLGLPLGVLLNITQPHGIWPHKWVNRILGWIINIGRSLPFIILMIAVMGFTKLIVGTKIGVRGAIPPLVISAAPFIARMVETSLAEVYAGVVESVPAALRAITGNGVNVLAMGAFYVAPQMGCDIADAYLNAELGSGYEWWHNFYEFHKLSIDELEAFNYAEYKKNGFKMKHLGDYPLKLETKPED